jgi:predicted small lipoprotein YifL
MSTPVRFTIRALVASILAASVAACGGANDDGPLVLPPAPTPGDTYALTTSNRLVTFNRDSPTLRTAVAITGLQAGETLVGFDIRPGGATAGELYVLASTGRLYTVNATTGAATLKATLAADATDATAPYAALDGTEFGLDFNPVVDRLRIVSNTGQNLRVNVDTGATITDGPLAATGVSATAYTNSFAAACRTALFYISSTTDRLVTTSDPNAGTLTDVGSLGVDVTGVNGFEIVTGSDGTNTGLALASVAGTPTLYRVNLTTGALTGGTAVSGLVGGENLVGIAAAPPAATPAQAPGNAVAVSTSNRLISFNTAAPQKLCTTQPISGLATGENALGLDTRPADGAVYVLGSTGRVYTVAVATGAATLKSTLVADATDTTNPYTALDGANFGVDFNPVPDRLRVVSDTGQNLRINVDTGATTTDTVLNPAGFAVGAAAYTNAFAGTVTTTLYGIDVAGDRLVIQGQPSGNPNAGDLQAVGALAIGDVQSAAGFDVDARTNAAFAALGLAGATTTDLYQLNLATGAATRVNTIGGGEPVRGLTLTTTARARGFGITADHRLVTFDPASPGTLLGSVAVTGLGSEQVVGADFRPATGALVALTDAGRLYRIDTATGAATLAAALAPDAADTTAPFTMLSGTAFGLDFNPTVDRLRVVGNTGQNLRINVGTGATTTDGTLTRAPFAVTAAAYTNSVAGATSTTLYVLDTRNDRLLVQSPPNDGTLVDVGALGLDADGVSGFDVVATDTALATLSTAAGANGLHSINLATGVATRIGTIALANASDRVTGLAAPISATPPAADSLVYAIVNRTALVAFPRNAPANTASAVAITGLQAGEVVVGADFRPADGRLYALGSTGRVYTVNTTTGAAQLAATLVADALDLTSPFAALEGEQFGVDFNPVPDRLRVVSDSGQNLRINVTTGATITDGRLNMPAPAVVAAAYTQSFAGATTTQLYDIDAATLTLQLQSPPNDGGLVTVGRLDPALSVSGTIGFDIAGGADGLVLASMTPAGATQSTLYRVNLRTGAATAVGAIGPSGTPTLRALAIQLQ